MGANMEMMPPPPQILFFPGNTASNITGMKRSERNEGQLENRSVCVEVRGDSELFSKKKLKLSTDQVGVLEETFKEKSTLNQIEKTELAQKLNLQVRQVEVWFQNRRARTKTRQTATECEIMRIHCEDLAEENRRLKKEVKNLKAQSYAQMQPQTTVNMCPRCNNVTTPFNSLATSTSTPAMGTENAWLINWLEKTGKEQK